MKAVLSKLDRESSAKQILGNPLYTEAIEELKQQLTSEWENTNVKDIETRESLYTALKLVDRIHSHFKSVLESGEIAHLHSQHPHI